jgi:hypothetical protein
MSAPSELIPNSFQVPNLIVDRLLPHLSGPQAKLLLVVCRQTFGWGKLADHISLSQFQRRGGVSRSSAVAILERFVSLGLLLKTAENSKEGYLWSLNLDANAAAIVDAIKAEKKPRRLSGCAAQSAANRSNARTSPPNGPVHQIDRNRSTEWTGVGPSHGHTETQLNPKPKKISSNATPSPVDTIWEYYKQKLKRSPHLELTKQRRVMGEAGLRACEKLARLNGSTNPAVDAVALMKLAIDRLAESPWHNGQNENGAKYLDWELLFRGRNMVSPQKLTEYWLNDEKFPESGVRGAA